MTTLEIILLSAIALIVILRIKKYISARNIKHYSGSEVKELLKSGNNHILLDVRTPAERKSQSIKNSLHIPLHELRQRQEELKKFKDKEIICYCRSGNRSVSAAVLLHKSGFNSANLKGGIIKYNFNN